MNQVTKPCRRCGSLMVNVNPQTLFCKGCKRAKSREAGRANYYKHREQILAQHKKKRMEKEAAPKKEKPTQKTSRRTKPLAQCTREAAALGLTYGQFVARGLDKE